VVADPGFAATGLNFQHNIALAMRLNRRGIKDTRAFHDAHANHAADAALPLTKACLLGEANDFWMGEMAGPRATSPDAAAHLAGWALLGPLLAAAAAQRPDALACRGRAASVEARGRADREERAGIGAARSAGI